MQKKFKIFIIIVLVSYTNIFAQQIHEQSFKSDVKSAVLYLTGAEISRTKSVYLKEGQNRLIFNNLSPKINSKSIRVKTKKGVDLLSVSNKINYLSKKKELPRIKKLKDSLEFLELRSQALTDETDAYNIEKKMLLENISIGGKDNGVSVTELKQASDFYRQRILEINKKISFMSREQRKLNIKKASYTAELAELNAKSSYTAGEVVILVSVTKAQQSDINLKYLVRDGGWSPVYDIKAEDTNKPVELIYRAKVYNNTGVDWKNLKKKLSSADPNLSVTQPELQPWYLNFKQLYKHSQIQKRREKGSGNMPQSSEGYFQNAIVSEDKMSGDITGSNTGEYSEATMPELNAEFDIKQRYDIPSDDKPYLVDVKEHNLPAEYKHFAVTKLDKDVFLLARISGWEDLNLIDGPANVYYAGTYLGQSFISTRNVKDTLNLSMGRDSKVLVTRSKLKDFSSTQFIGNKRKETLTYELIAKNNRKNTINIDILDQVPISQSDDIEVKILEISDAETNDIKGELKWNFNLKPGESRKIRISFSIKYPKTKTIEIQKKKSRQVRYF